jgi:proteasome lid subunit RPN8/RPN11
MSPSVRADILQHSREARPAECCGILIGRDATISQSRRAANRADDPLRRFLIDPKAHVDAIRAARAEGLQVVGFYHSHPHSAAEPSAADIAEATYAEGLYLIVGFPPAGDAELRGYEWTGEAFAPVGLIVSPWSP